MTTSEVSSKPDFRTRAKSNDVPIARLIGFEAKEIAEGRAIVTLAAGPQHANPMGTLHGGVLCDIADAAMGMAFASTLAPRESFTTVELKINFFRPIWEARLKAEGKVVRRGRNVGYVECEITDERGQLIAKASSTCLALRGDDAKGRLAEKWQHDHQITVGEFCAELGIHSHCGPSSKQCNRTKTPLNSRRFPST
jgi:uncharacterized protein (TIGR00369 family)